MKIAALDLGSNTFLCLIAEVENNQVKEVYSDNVEIVRLGQGLAQNKKFHPEALARADACLGRFKEIIKKNKPEKILAMATSAARDALNAKELFAIAEKHEIPLEIIPGEKEAEITFFGALSASKDKMQKKLIVDIGGGSTEFIYGEDFKIKKAISFDIGCVRLTEKFIKQQPTPKAEVKQVTDFILESLNQFKSMVQDGEPQEIVAVAGTPTALVSAEIGGFDKDKIDGYQLTQKNLTKWVEKLSQSSIEEKVKMGIEKGRADVILIGAITLLEVLKLFNKEQLTVSTRGVRYGVALEVYRRQRSI